MCGHGAIGLITTLAWLGQITPGIHRIETPVGVVTTELQVDGRVSVTNVPSYRYAHDVRVLVPGLGIVTGDVAWGGNWFFICDTHHQTLEPARIEVLVDFCVALRQALAQSGITGAHGAAIDHIELIAPGDIGFDAKNFVLCPGQVYDRSPCGTGTSARLACLFTDGRLTEGQRYRVQSIIGSCFEGTVRVNNSEIIPTIIGQAWVTADSTLIFNADDPYCFGLK
jgi:4-hydroxyproline epimerase